MYIIKKENKYGLSISVPIGVFHVDALTGNVTVSGEVNKEHNSRYFIKIRAGAKNCGLKINDTNTGEGGNTRPDKFITATVWVNVIDVNDNAPRFLNGQDRLFYEEVVQSFIIQLNATDEDEGLGGEVGRVTRIYNGVSYLHVFHKFVNVKASVMKCHTVKFFLQERHTLALVDILKSASVNFA